MATLKATIKNDALKASGLIKKHSDTERKKGASMGYFYEIIKDSEIIFTSGYFKTKHLCVETCRNKLWHKFIN